MGLNSVFESIGNHGGGMVRAVQYTGVGSGSVFLSPVDNNRSRVGRAAAFDVCKHFVSIPIPLFHSSSLFYLSHFRSP